jgi:hypothetical protein
VIRILFLALALASSPLLADGTDGRSSAAASPAAAPRPPAAAAPRLTLPPPPRFDATAEPSRVSLAWGGRTISVETTVRGGPHARTREIVPSATHVEVRDTIVNSSEAPIGLRIRHTVPSTSSSVRVGGRADAQARDLYDPWNPTVFGPVAAGGVGLVAEDDVFRQQVFVSFDASTRTLGLRTDMLCLAPGDRYTMRWSIYPTATGDYWDFINTVRAEWGVNRTVPGAYAWFTPDPILDMPPERLRAALERERIGIASLAGGWVDPKRPERPPLIGFGTFVMSPAFESYRDRVRAAVRKLRAARPELMVLVYFDAQRDSTPGAPERFPDSVLTTTAGSVERTSWGGRFAVTWSMVPTAVNGFGRAMQDVAKAMVADLGADGLYWDEMDAVDYAAPRVTTRTWDGRTCRLDDAGNVRAKLALANLLSDDVKLRYANVGLVLGNSPPTTRRFQTLPAVRMIEAQHNDLWGAYAHLTTPLGYISGARTDFAMVTSKIEEGLLVAGTRLDYPHELVGRMFPFTPEDIRPGTLRGRERIITTRSGAHGWTSPTSAVRMFRYDAAGKEHPAAWATHRVGEGLTVDVELRPGEAAVIERQR